MRAWRNAGWTIWIVQRWTSTLLLVPIYLKVAEKIPNPLNECQASSVHSRLWKYYLCTGHIQKCNEFVWSCPAHWLCINVLFYFLDYKSWILLFYGSSSHQQIREMEQKEPSSKGTGFDTFCINFLHHTKRNTIAFFSSKFRSSLFMIFSGLKHIILGSNFQIYFLMITTPITELRI